MLERLRYEYDKETTKVFDNELDCFVDDVVVRLNEQHYNKIDLLRAKHQADQYNIILETALYNLASAVSKDSCYYCPIQAGGGERCYTETCENCKEHKPSCAIKCQKIIHEDSDACIEKIVKFYIKQATKEIEKE